MRVLLTEASLPLRSALTTAAGRITRRRVVLVSVGRGWGEAAPFPGLDDESIDDVWDAFLTDSPLPPTAAAALDAAAWDDDARTSGVSLAQHCGATGGPAPLSQAIGVLGREATLQAVAAAIESGCAGVKLKVADAADAEKVAAVVAAFPGLTVGADANGSMRSLQDALAFERAGAAYIEQPFEPTALAAHRDLRARLATTEVILDESVRTVGDVERILALGAADRLCLKPGRLGVSTTLRIAQQAREAGVGVKIGGMFDSAVGRSTASSLARLDQTRFNDIAPHGAYFSQDVGTPDPTLPGIGFTPAAADVALRTAAVEHAARRGTVGP